MLRLLSYLPFHSYFSALWSSSYATTTTNSAWDSLVASMPAQDDEASNNSALADPDHLCECRFTTAILASCDERGSKQFTSTLNIDNKTEADPTIPTSRSHSRKLSISSFHSDATTLCEAHCELPEWMLSMQVDVSDASSPNQPTWTEIGGTLYRNGHARGITIAAHDQQIETIQEANKELLVDLSDVTNCVEQAANATIACLKEKNASALVAIQHVNGLKVSGLLEERGSMIDALKSMHEHAISSLRKEQKSTVGTLLTKHHTELEKIKETKNGIITSLQHQHYLAVTSLERRHELTLCSLKQENQAALSVLRAELTGLRDANRKQLNEISTLTIRVQREITSKKALQSELGDHQGAFRTTLLELGTANSKINFLKREITALRKSKDSALAELSASSQRLQEESRVTIHSLRNEAEALREAKDAAIEELSASSERVQEESQATIDSLLSKVQTKESALEELSASSQSLQEQSQAVIDSLKREVQALQEDNETLSDQVSVASRRALAEKEVAIEHLKDELEKKDFEHAANQEVLRIDLVNLTLSNNNLTAQFQALQKTNEHNSQAFIEAKEAAEHNQTAWEEVNGLLKMEQQTVKSLKKELADVNVRCDELAADAKLSDEKKTEAQLNLRNLALDEMYVQRVEWSNTKQAGHVRRLLAEKVPLDNYNIRLFNENLRIKEYVEDVRKGMKGVRAYAEDVFDKTLPLLQEILSTGVLNVAILAERTSDEIIDGLASFLNSFMESCNGNIEAGRNLITENTRLTDAAKADRATINILRHEIADFENKIRDKDRELQDLQISEQAAVAERDSANAVVDELIPATERVHELEEQILNLEDAAIEARTADAPPLWKEVVDDLKTQLEARRLDIEELRLRARTFEEEEKHHQDCKQAADNRERQGDFHRQIIAALLKRNHDVVDELVRTRAAAGLPPRTYEVDGGAGISKVHMRAMLDLMAEYHGHPQSEVDRVWAEEMDEVMSAPVDEADLPPLDRDFTAAERVIGGVLDRITHIGRLAIDAEGESTVITHRDVNPVPIDADNDDSGDTETTAWGPLDLSTDLEEQKAADERFEEDREKRRALAEKVRDEALKEELENAILEQEAF